MKITTASAPGKLILFGEHAVIYGYPCIGIAISKRISATVQQAARDKIITPSVVKSPFVEEALKYFRQKYKVVGQVLITTNGDFSHHVGLGSSSAVTVAVIKALSQFFNIKLSSREVFDISYKIVLSIQKVGSGFDVAVAAYGGALYFKNGGGVIEQLSISQLPLIIGYSGTKADTATIVKKISQEYKKNTRFAPIFSSIGNIVDTAKNTLVEGNFEKAGKLMTENHRLLQELGVSTKKLNEMVEAAISAGAYGGKLSGAGGGDCMIALVERDKQNSVMAAIQKVGGEIVSAL